jgi:hypothetical protein
MLLVLVPLALAWGLWAPAGTGHRGAAPQLSIAGRSLVHGRGERDLAASVWSAARELNMAAPSVLLSIETTGAAADADFETPVVLPGYLLPDDNHEEAAHEGS